MADNDGNTPLIVGVRRLPVVRMLVEAGADTSMRNKEGKTALEKAEELAGADGRMVQEYLRSGEVTPPARGWRVWWDEETETADRSVLTKLNEELWPLIETMKEDTLAKGPLPRGALVILGQREHAEEVAAHLSIRGGPKVGIDQVAYDVATEQWRVQE